MSLWGAILVQTTTPDGNLGAIPAPGFLNSIKGNLLDGYAETPMQTHLGAASVLCMLLVTYILDAVCHLQKLPAQVTVGLGLSAFPF